MEIKNKVNTETFLLFSGCMVGFCFHIVLLITFISAYLTTTKSTLVRVNAYGEANYELILLFLLVPFFLICLIYGFKKVLRGE